MDSVGNTPAHLAAFPGDVDTMQVLIAAGFGFHTRGGEGKNILHRAMFNRKGVLEYLLKQEGVREIIHIKDNRGDTPLSLAKFLDQRKVVERLVDLAKNRGRSLHQEKCQVTSSHVCRSGHIGRHRFNLAHPGVRPTPRRLIIKYGLPDVVRTLHSCHS